MEAGGGAEAVVLPDMPAAWHILLPVGQTYWFFKFIFVFIEIH